MKLQIKSSMLAALAAVTMVFVAQPASAQDWGYHAGWHRYHVYRNHHWGYVYHPVGWTVPAAWVGPTVAVTPGVSLGWGYHPGWTRYHVYRNNSWGYVYHPAGWAVPREWAGPRGGYHGRSWHRHG